MANNGPLGTAANPGFVNAGTSALTLDVPPGPTCASKPTRAQIECYAMDAAHRLRMATDWIDTRSAIGSFLGSHSFSAGVVAGMVKNLAGSVYELAKLLKTFALAEYYETQHAQSFWDKFTHASALGLPGLLTLGAGTAASYFWPQFDEEARAAFEEREVLFKTVAYAFQHPGQVFATITADQKKKSEAFESLRKRHSLAGEFQAGVLFGELLLDVLLIIDGVTAIAKIAAKIPGLLKMLPRLEKLAPALRNSMRNAGAAAKDAAKAESVTASTASKELPRNSAKPPKIKPPTAEAIGSPINGATKTVPLGFKNQEQFATASKELQEALQRSDITDATVGVRGSSVTGSSLTKGTQFGPQSDIDFFVESKQLTEAYKTSNNIPGFVHPNKIMPDYPLLQEWSSKWSGTLGRDVSVGGFVPGTLPTQPAIIVK